MKGNGISVIIITCNEEKSLGRALDSVRNVADQVVIVDTGSTDETVRIARSHPLRPDVYETSWVNDFSAVRNMAISLCRYAWCLVLDADEYIDERCRPHVRRLMEKHLSERPRSLYAPLIDNLNGKLLRNNPRIFSRRDSLKFHGRVHEYLRDTEDSEVGYLHEIVINHSGYLTEFCDQNEKYSRNQALLRLQMDEEPDSFRWKYFSLRYMDIPSPGALSVLHDFGRIPLPYDSSIEVYAFNAKSCLIQCLLDEGCWDDAYVHVSELYLHYQDYDTTLLHIAATLRYARRKLEQAVIDCDEKLTQAPQLERNEYLHATVHPELINHLQDELSSLHCGLFNER